MKFVYNEFNVCSAVWVKCEEEAFTIRAVTADYIWDETGVGAEASRIPVTAGQNM
ncbi:MAG: hypothetical protein K2H52_15640 [Lachnospiraceae bacterium]|nr:hypothetical protein [Lachnospiraceae bacterium]MDE7286528.1 hypothetical protein [Lachnospiraceae bacterium]